MKRTICTCDRCKREFEENDTARLTAIQLCFYEVRGSSLKAKSVHSTMEVCTGCLDEISERFAHLVDTSPAVVSGKQPTIEDIEKTAVPEVKKVVEVLSKSTAAAIGKQEQIDNVRFAEFRDRVRKNFAGQYEPLEILCFINRAVAELGITQRSLAEACGMKDYEISLLKTSRKVYPYIKAAIAQHYGVTVYGLNDQPEV